jgi:hypothetical protein
MVLIRYSNTLYFCKMSLRLWFVKNVFFCAFGLHFGHFGAMGYRAILIPFDTYFGINIITVFTIQTIVKRIAQEYHKIIIRTLINHN